MKLLIKKTARIGDAEVETEVVCQVSSQAASFQVSDLVKAATVKMARDVKELAERVKAGEEKKEKDLDEKHRRVDSLVEEPPLRLRKKESRDD